VLVENFALATLDRLGLRWDTLRELHSGLIYASVRGFGDWGPLANYRSFDMVGQAAGGAMSVNGDVGGPPVRLGVTLGDTGTGVHCAVGILAAYIERLETGLGQRAEGSMQEAVINFTRVAMASRYLTGQPPPRAGSRLRGMAPSDLYRCEGDDPNAYAYLVVTTPEMWDGVLRT